MTVDPKAFLALSKEDQIRTWLRLYQQGEKEEYSQLALLMSDWVFKELSDTAIERLRNEVFNEELPKESTP